jgi:hypothetical protein
LAQERQAENAHSKTVMGIFPNEFVRHKLLDLLGDISLVGYPIIGHLYAERAGHAIHTALAAQIARLQSHYRICTAVEFESAWQTDPALPGKAVLESESALSLSEPR